MEKLTATTTARVSKSIKKWIIASCKRLKWTESKFVNETLIEKFEREKDK